MDDVASKTRIRRLYLKALEEDRDDILPGEAYRAGFLRIYAELLDLDPADLQRREPQLEPESESFPAENAVPAPPFSHSPRQSRKGLALGVGAICLVFAAIAAASLVRTSSPRLPAHIAPEVHSPAAAPALNPVSAEKRQGETAESERTEISLTASPAVQLETENRTEAAQKALEPPSAAGTSPDALPAVDADSSSDIPSGILSLTGPSGILRIQAIGSTRLLLEADDFQSRTYNLIKGAQLSWRISRSAHLQIENPSMVKLWLGQKPLELSGHSELVLSTATDSI